MDYREDSFRRKFAVAAQYLGAPPEQIVSLKLREDVSSYDDYRQLGEILHQDAGLQWSEIPADLQGRGYLLGDGNARVIVVEHETGLELLYIAGSIASLMGLVPLVLEGWRALRGRFAGRRAMPDHGLEIRRIDDAGRLREDHLHDRFPGPFLAMGSVLPAIATTAGLVEIEIRTLSDQIQRLNSRVEALENQRHSLVPPRPKPHTTPEASKRRTATRKETKIITYRFGCEWRDLVDLEICDCWCDLQGWKHQWKSGIRWRDIETGLKLPSDIAASEHDLVMGVDSVDAGVMESIGWRKVDLNADEITGIARKTWFAKAFVDLSQEDRRMAAEAVRTDYLTGRMGH